MFWKKQPALLYGLAFYLGIALALGYVWALFPLCLIGASSLSHKKRLGLFILTAIAAFLFIKMSVVVPPDHPVKGTAHIHIDSLTPYKTSFHEGYRIQGTLRTFHAPDLAAQNIPFTMKVPKKHRYQADRDYTFFATLRKSQNGHAHLFAAKGTLWKPVPMTWSPAEWRLKNKESLERYISSKITNKQAASFLSGIATGLFYDSSLKAELSRFGLQHIMAISGFHFALVAFLLSFSVRSFLSDKASACIVVFLLTLYFIFLGATPSILRAWIMAVIYFMGKIFEKSGRPLNSLGIALIAVLLTNPLSAAAIGFQFTFLVTGSILLFTSPFEHMLRSIFKKRSLSELLQMSLLDQHGYIILNAIRNILALTLAVQIAAFPLALYSFQKFPLLSFVYNAFFPFLVSFSIFLLLLGLLLSPIPPLSSLIHHINNSYTEMVLNVAYQLPTSLDTWVRVESLPGPLIVFYLSFVMYGGIWLDLQTEKKQRERRDLAYL